MFDIGAYLAQFSETWNLFIRWKLPAFIDDNEDGRFGLIDGKPALARIMMPLVGAVMGICLYLPLWGITAVFGHVAGAIAAAVLVPPAIELATGWTGLSALATYFQLRRAGASAFCQAAVHDGAAPSGFNDRNADDLRSADGDVRRARLGLLFFLVHCRADRRISCPYAPLRHE